MPNAARRPTRYVALLVLAAVICAGSAAPAGSSSVTAAGETQLLVKFRQGVSAALERTWLANAGASPVGTIRDLDVEVVSAPEARANAILQRLRASAHVAFAERNGALHITDTSPNDPWWPNEAALAHVNAPGAWDITRGSPSVVIAVLDTGVDPTQPDLVGGFVPGYDFVNNDADPSDDQGHGTQAAGVAAARTDNLRGVASYCWSCSIMPVKVMDATGSGNAATVAQGITWAVDHGARVISMSFAGSSGYSTLQSAVKYAHDKGAVLVAAAGNYGSTTPMYPAAYTEVVSVAGTNLDDTLNTSSDYGSWVKVAAPWCNWTTAKGGLYGTYCGTSSATPAVSGIAGLAFALNPGASNAQVEQTLESGAAPVVGSHGVQYGRVDALGTLTAMGGTQTGTPPAPVALPAISGTPQEGQTLTAASGSWAGSTPMTFAYQWRRCDSTGASCVDLAGATGQTYTAGAPDLGSTIRASVTASNSFGSSAATSAATGVVVAAPSGTASAVFSGTLNKRQATRSFTLTIAAAQTIAALQFAKGPSLTLTVRAADGSSVASASGPSIVSLVSSLAAGTYSFVVSGSGNVSFTLTVTYSSP